VYFFQLTALFLRIAASDAQLTLVLPFSQFLAFIGIIACMFTSGPESVARAFGTTTIQWGTEATKYQACRSDNTSPLPNLVAVQRWNSKKDMPAESITAVTHISLDR
jgi:hypothetical protein